MKLDKLKIESARRAAEAIDREEKRQRQEDRRRLAVNWIVGIFAFVGVNGSFFTLLLQLGIFELFADQWGLGALSACIISILYFGYVILCVSTFFWLSDKTGLHYLIEDWVVSWDTWDAQRSHNIPKFKKFPRKERKPLVKDLKKELDVITDNLYRFEEEADDSDDEELSKSAEEINQVIGSLVSEADSHCRSLSLQPHGTSWKGFVLTLEETSNDLELEFVEIAKYHKKVQPLIRQASQIVTKVLSRIINS